MVIQNKAAIRRSWQAKMTSWSEILFLSMYLLIQPQPYIRSWQFIGWSKSASGFRIGTWPMLVIFRFRKSNSQIFSFSLNASIGKYRPNRRCYHYMWCGLKNSSKSGEYMLHQALEEKTSTWLPSSMLRKLSVSEIARVIRISFSRVCLDLIYVTHFRWGSISTFHQHGCQDT
jgi:hypothetical protein